MHAPDGEVHRVGGVYREVEPNSRLVYTWAWESTPERESLVTVEFRPSGEGTELLLTHQRFADIEARDRVFDGSPLAWAAVGSGEQPSSAPDPDWEEVVRTLLDAGASTDGIVLEAGEVSQSTGPMPRPGRPGTRPRYSGERSRFTQSSS